MNQELKEILTGLKRSISLIDKPEKKWLWLAILLMAVVGLLTNLPAIIIGRLVDQMTAKSDFSFLLALPFILSVLLIILIREGLTIARKLIIENIKTQTEKKQTVNVIERLLKSDMTFINEQQIGSLHGRVLRSIQGLTQIIKLSFLEFLPIFFSALAAVLLALYQKPLLASVMILVIPSGLYIILKQISSQKGIRVDLLRGKEKIDGTVVEMLGGLETIRVAGTTNHEVSKIESITEGLRVKEIKHHLSMALFDAAKHFNEGLSYILVVSLAIYLSTLGIITKGDILVYSILFLSVTAPVREIHRILDHAHEGSIQVNDLHQLLNQPLDYSFKAESLTNLNRSELTDDLVLEIKNLSFSYPKRNQTLANINLSIKLGEKIGIAGASGSGKSTLIKILLRLIHNYQGKVLLFGKDLADISREEIAQKIAYIPQKSYIFSGTIKDNITYGVSKKVSEEDLVAASKKANIYQEITSSLGGFEGKVAENGNNLSGGQKQRLALTRLILKNPDLFIFDEATSALDNTNERIIQENLEKIFKDKTFITIAHRLTTLKNSDRILVFEKGGIVQEGNYSSLSNNPGLFKEFLEQTVS